MWLGRERERERVCVCVCARSVKSYSMQPYGLYPTRLICPSDFPGKNTGAVATSYSRDLPHTGSKPVSLASPAVTGGFFTTGTTCIHVPAKGIISFFVVE